MGEARHVFTFKEKENYLYITTNVLEDYTTYI